MSRRLIPLLVLASAVGVFVSLAAWAFLELIHQIQVGLFTDLPESLGYDHGAPAWFYVVVLGIAGLLTAAAIDRLPGEGGHVPAEGLKIGGAPVQPVELPAMQSTASHRAARSRQGNAAIRPTSVTSGNPWLTSALRWAGRLVLPVARIRPIRG